MMVKASTLSEGFGLVGQTIGGDTGEQAARWAYFLASLTTSVGGSIKLTTTNQKLLTTVFKKQGIFRRMGETFGDGIQIDRMRFNYFMENVGGRCYIDIINKKSKSVFRYQTVLTEKGTNMAYSVPLKCFRFARSNKFSSNPVIQDILELQ